MIVKLLTEPHLRFLSLEGGCEGSSESTLVKITHCWNSHAVAHLSLNIGHQLKTVGTNRLAQSVHIKPICKD